jgi:hypothetical protein
MNTADLRPFVVTGTARSGTTYMAALLGGLGLDLGHEDLFGPRTRSFDGWHGKLGDSSWLAAPFLGDLGDALVFHQVRHPLKVARSLLGMKFLADRSGAYLLVDDAYCRAKWKIRERLMAAGHVPFSDHGPRPNKVYRDYVTTYAPQLWEPASEVERVLLYWHDWTRMVISNAKPDHYHRSHRETLSAEGIAELLGLVGLTVSPQHIALAMAKVPSDTNTYGPPPKLEWDEVPAGAIKDRVAALAEDLGYDPADPRRTPGGLTR